MDFGESRREKMGGLSFDSVKPASCGTSPIIKSFSPCKEISQEAIEKKLKEAEERRMQSSDEDGEENNGSLVDIDGGIIKKLKFDDAEPSRVLHIRGLPKDVTESEVICLGKQFGQMTNVLITRKKNEALLEMADVSAAELMLKFYAERPPQIRNHEVHLRFSRHVNVITDRNRAQNAGAQAALQVADQMIASNEETRTVLRVVIENLLHPVTIEVLHTIFSKLGQVLKIITYTKNDTFQALVQLSDPISAKTAIENLNGQNVYNGCCTLRIDYSKLQDFIVMFNNEKMWDFTNPNLPPRNDQPQQKPDPDTVKNGLLGAYGSAFRGKMAGQPRHLDNLMAVGELCVAGGDGDRTIPVTNFDPQISDELKDADEVGTNEANDQPDYSDNKDQRDETKEVAAEAVDSNDNLEDVEDGAGGGGPPSSHSDEGDDPEDLLNTHLNNLIEIHNLMLQMPQLTNGITKNRNSCPILFWGSPDVSDFVLKFFDDEMTLNHLHAEIIPHLPTSTQALINAAAERCVASAPSFFVILGLGETREHDQVVLDRLESFTAGGHAVTVVATATDIGDMDGTAIRLKFPAVHVPVVFNVEPLVNQPQE